jgi:hypothetical protein
MMSASALTRARSAWQRHRARSLAVLSTHQLTLQDPVFRSPAADAVLYSITVRRGFDR